MEPVKYLILLMRTKGHLQVSNPRHLQSKQENFL